MRQITRQLSKAAEVEYFIGVLENIAEGIIVIDTAGIMLGCNSKTQTIFGYRRNELIGNNVNMLMPEPHRSRHDQYLHRYLDTGEARIIGHGRNLTGRRADGRLFPMDLAVSEIKCDGVHHFIGIIRDISELKALEAQFYAAQKMEALGEMVSGIAHYFKYFGYISASFCR